MADTRRNLHQPLKGKQVYRALYGVYTETLHDLTVIKVSPAKRETAKTILNLCPSRNSVRKEDER
jgi:hypothetical protein